MKSPIFDRLTFAPLLFLAIIAAFMFSSCEKEIIEPVTQIDTPDVIVQPAIPSDFIAETKVSTHDFRPLLMSMQEDGYMPVWIDAFTHTAGNSVDQYHETLYNVVFDKNPDNLKWEMHIGLTEDQLSSKFSLLLEGYKVHQLESYIDGANRKFAVIFVEGSASDQYFMIDKKNAVYQQTYNQKSEQGYRLVCRSIVHIGEERFYTAVMDKKEVGLSVPFSNLDEDGIQIQMENAKADDRMAAYLDISQVGTTSNIRFNPVFNEDTHSDWYALNKLSEEQLGDALAEAKTEGYDVTFLCGYDEKGLINGNEVNFVRYAVGFKK
ncbi:hypothetical protein [Phaeodactylibacter xiamenensis]|uniref:hypothetical protein n=1 Tax=Phaeodactylibacter xiamenensis TaxID=1524460 RepID=UPI0024A7FD96|nr:hypothetical protein [Phaeodactylibacter xiamenensis]